MERVKGRHRHMVFKYLGLTLAVLGLALTVVPQFTDCESQGKSVTLASGSTIPMKCHWTARAEMAVGIPLVTVGGLMTLGRRKESLMGLSGIGLTLGIFAILLPTVLIGTCQNPTMVCNTAMKPSLLALGSLVIGVGLLGTVLAARARDRA
jgi:hypothetical protein